MRNIFGFLLLLVFLCVDVSAESVGDNYDNPLVVMVTPQKTGTHLLGKALGILLEKRVIHWWWDDLSDKRLQGLITKCKNENRILHTHAFPVPHIMRKLKQNHAKVIFLMRDPRDQIVSLLYWIKDKQWPGGPQPLVRSTAHYTDDELLLELISGKNFGVSYTKTLMGCRLPWMEYPFVYTTYFEKLVGSKGGSSNEEQVRELQAIIGYLGVYVSESSIRECAENLFGGENASTFRNGSIGAWKTHFKSHHTEAFKEAFGQELIDLGYEDSFDWQP